MILARARRALVRTLIVLVPTVALAQPVAATARPSIGVSAQGALTGAPEGGVETVDGPRIVLDDGFAEWYAVAYRSATGRVERVGSGSTADWAGRTPVETTRFSRSDSATISVTRAAALALRTELRFDEAGRYLLVRVTLTNRGEEWIEDLVYTREWRTSRGEAWTFPSDVEGLRPTVEGVSRRVWSLGRLAPGASTGLSFSYRSAGEESSAASAVDVPLALWTSAIYPTGMGFGATNGISWGDYDSDGYPDIFACQSGALWRNVAGLDWQIVAALDGTVLPPTERRYGASFGDYNNDGRPDIGTEPRVPVWGDDKMHLLRNLGGAQFDDVLDDPNVVNVQPHNNGETLCWGDVTGDGNLDAFLPVYPDSLEGPGNFFLRNEGPSGPDGQYRFREKSAQAGLDNPPGAARPEGAQFVDVDADGDIDLYSNGTLYQNQSKSSGKFEAMAETASGIGLSASLDEGAMLFDYDMDGDQDLFVVYTADGVRIWENYGDGTFFAAESSIVDDPLIGLNLGMSAEDWDNDGDIDFTTRQVFRRNMLIEDGSRHFVVATHGIDPGDLTSATPAWADWDLDGDLDCALGNWGSSGRFYENTLYGETTPETDRRHLRVRVVRDSPTVPRGLEVEYGATVNLFVADEPLERRRTKFVASSHGYLNQNEYTLHFGLPEDPQPGSDEDLSLAVVVDFPGLSSDDLWRVDRHVNPVLGELGLEQRQIDVYRCGAVVVDDVLYDPIPDAVQRLTTTTGGLELATATAALAAPTPAPTTDWFVGLAFETPHGGRSVRIKEIILDGQLDTAAPCVGDPFNIVLWDVTDPGSPQRVAGGSLERVTAPRNRRSYFRTDLVLPPGRSYRLVARVTELRATPIDGPVDHGLVNVLGGLSYTDSLPCGGGQAAVAPVDESATSLALRLAPVPSSEQADPIGSDLRMDKFFGGVPRLVWPTGVGDDYAVVRCDATTGSCMPSPLVLTTTSPYDDSDAANVPGSLFWYRVRAVNSCTAAILAEALP